MRNLLCIFVVLLLVVSSAIAATAGSGVTVDSDGEDIFDAETDGGRVTTFVVACLSTGDQDALVNIPGLHKAGEFFRVRKGTKEYFRLGNNQITTVFVKGNGGNTTIDFGVIARTGSYGMSVSVVKICNIALARIGVSQQIDSIDESSTAAIACKLFYEQTRDRVLRDFNWPFARRYVALALVAEQPNDDWLFAYRYPSDCIRVRRVVTALGRRNPSPEPFDIGHDSEGRLIYTDHADATIEYTVRVSDPTQFDPAFVSALAWLLAVEVSMPLSVNAQLRQQAAGGYMAEIAAASAIAANEQQQTPEPDSEFIRARS